MGPLHPGATEKSNRNPDTYLKVGRNFSKHVVCEAMKRKQHHAKQAHLNVAHPCDGDLGGPIIPRTPDYFKYDGTFTGYNNTR